MRITAVLVALLGFASPGFAQRHDLPVPAGKGWQHADSGVILTAALAGLPRTALVDNGNAERDVIAEFADVDRATVATVYIFRPALMNVGIWFDRAQTAIELRDVYGGAVPVAPLPTPVARPGETIAAGLRQVYLPGHGRYKSTALAVIPVGPWLVAVRLSSTLVGPTALDARLSALIAAIRWPAATGDAVPARPVSACADALVFHDATQMKPDMTQTLLGSVLAGATLSGRAKASAPLEWCRDPVAPTVDYGVYRPGAARDGYTLAIADSGRIAGVYQGITLPGDAAPGGYAVSYTDLDESVATFPSFDRLPEPRQVFDLVLRHAPLARTTAGPDGKTNVSIRADPR